MGYLFSFLALLSFGHVVSGFRVLMLASNVGYSHLEYTGKLADILVNAGHEVDYVIEVWDSSSKHNGSRKANIIRYEGKNTDKIMKTLMSIGAWEDPFESEWSYNEMGMFGDILALHCDAILSDQKMMSFLRSRNYTVAMAENYDLCAWPIFDLLGIKSIHELNAIALPENTAFSHGIPFNFRHIPVIQNTEQVGPIKSTLQLIRNVYEYLKMRYYLPILQFEPTNRVLRRLIDENYPTTQELQRHSSYIWINTHEFIDFVRANPPKVKHIGGIAVKAPPALNEETALVFEKAKSGVVLVSFGSIVDTTAMKPKLRTEMLAAFSRFPDYEFIWRLTRVDENISAIIQQYPNVNAFSWVQQAAILAHPKTKGFITHMGLNSFNEAAHFGVPIVAIPFFGDQQLNSAMAIRKGFASYVSRREINTKTLSHALGEILHNEKYRNIAQDLKAKIASAPTNAADVFLKHVEFAEKFGRLEDLDLETADDNIFEQFHVDLIVIGVLLALSIYWILSFLTKRMVLFLKVLSESLRVSKVKKNV